MTCRAISHHGGGEVAGHVAGARGAPARSFFGLSLSASRPVAARDARFGVPTAAKGDQRQRLLLAHARLRTMPHSILPATLLAR